MHEEHREAVRAAASAGVRWETVIETADRHGLVPLLHRHAVAGAVDLPAASMADLSARATTNVRRSLRMTMELLGLTGMFAEHGIAAVPLKGPVLGERLYGSVALRRYRDLDILFDRQDLATVERLLIARGCRVVRGFSALLDPLAQEKAHHLTFVTAGGVKVEAHYHLVPAYGGRGVDYSTLVPSLVATKFGGQTITTLAPEETLVYLCQHGASHAWTCLEWLVSVAESVRQGAIGDWGRVDAFAHRLGEQGRVAAALQLADELIGPVVRPPVDVAATRSARAANRAVVGRLRREPERIIARISEPFLYQVRTDADWRAAARRCWTTLAGPTPSDSFGIALPRALWPLYYAIRPLRLTAHHGRRVLSGTPPTPPAPNHGRR